MGENRRKKIAVLGCNMMHREYGREMLKGIINSADRKDYDLYIFKTQFNSNNATLNNAGEMALFDVANLKSFDGIIFFGSVIYDEDVRSYLIDKILHSGVPCVSVDDKIEGMTFVGGENVNSMFELTSHLIKVHDCKSFVFLAGAPDNIDSNERKLGFQLALEDNGLSFEECTTFYYGDFLKHYGVRIGEKLVSKPLPDAVVCASDWIAQGVLLVFQQHGIRVPEDVIITGFDYDFDGRNSVPRITSINRDVYSAGKKVLETMADIIDGKEVDEVRSECYPVYLESCGCHNDIDNNINDLRKIYSFDRNMTVDIGIASMEMIADLSEQKNLVSFKSHLQNHVKMLGAYSFYFCMPEELVASLESGFEGYEFSSDIPDKMVSVLSYENEDFVDLPAFSSADMVPHVIEREGSSHVYEFFPLHIKNYFTGYVVIDRCTFTENELMSDIYMREINTALDLLIKHNRLTRALYKFEELP